MIFNIPVNKYENLKKKVERIERKGGQVKFEDLGTVYVSDDFGLKHRCYKVDIEGEYKINGWEFIATLEHTSNGNIIRKAVDVEIPDKYKIASPVCDHCHSVRDRKDTYIIRNVETGEFKQVGRSCLKEYTGGLSAVVSAEIASIIELASSSEGDFGDDSFSYSGTSLRSSDYLKKIIYPIIRKSGYVKEDRKTLRQIDAALDKQESPLASDEQIQEVNEWVKTLDTTSDYFRNAFLAWNKEDIEYRDIALIASLINVYFKDKQKQKEREESPSDFVGNVGDKITIEIVSSKVLYQKDAYAYNSPITYVQRLVDKDGNIFVWSTSKLFMSKEEAEDSSKYRNLGKDDIVIDGSVKIQATVKDHKEYKGEKQTVITRGKILTESVIHPGTFNIDEVFNLLNNIED